MYIKLNVSKIIILISLLLSLGIPDISYYFIMSLFYCPKLLEIDNPLGFIIPYLFIPSFFNFIVSMYIFYYNSLKVELYFGSKKYIFIFLLSCILTSLISFCLALFFKRFFNYLLFWESLWYGITPITLCLRTFYFYKIDMNFLIFGNEINSKNMIWIELLILTLGDSLERFGILLAGVITGNLLYYFF
jgi:hypothetical protein